MFVTDRKGQVFGTSRDGISHQSAASTEQKFQTRKRCALDKQLEV